MSTTIDTTPTQWTLRHASERDREALVRLAQLDSQREPAGDLLVAESEGAIVAALPLDGSAPIANPFVRTAELIDLLRVRAAQLDSGQAPRRRRIRVRAARRLRAAHAA